MLNQENWKPIVGYEGLYEVSNLGRIKSLFDGRRNIYREKILKPSIKKEGYLKVVLSKDGKTTNKYIHRLVAEAFIPNPENKSIVDHINQVINDNRLENLQWLTYSENNKKAYNQGKVNSEKQRFSASENGKLNQIISTWINDKLDLEFEGNCRDLVRAFPDQDLKQSNLWCVQKGKNKQSKGWRIN